MLKTSEEQRAWLKKDIKFQSRPVYPELLDDIETLLEDNKRLREALEWYADEKTWAPQEFFNSDIVDDQGQRAREALGRKVGG